MDLQKLSQQLKEKNWKNIKHNSVFCDYQFDITAERMHLLFVKWYVLIKTVPYLDEKTLKTQLQIFKEISSKSKSMWIGKMFLYVIVAGGIDKNLEPQIRGDQWPISINAWFTMAGSSPRMQIVPTRIYGGGGNLMAYDEENMIVYGEIPSIPWDVKKYSEQLRDMLEPE